MMSTARGAMMRSVGSIGLAIALLAGCSGGESPVRESPGAELGFPATIDTAYGEITMEAEPARIVVLDGRQPELLQLLGETPAAFASYGATPEEFAESSPWLDPADLAEPSPALFTGDLAPSA